MSRHIWGNENGCEGMPIFGYEFVKFYKNISYTRPNHKNHMICFQRASGQPLHCFSRILKRFISKPSVVLLCPWQATVLFFWYALTLTPGCSFRCSMHDLWHVRVKKSASHKAIRGWERSELKVTKGQLFSLIWMTFRKNSDGGEGVISDPRYAVQIFISCMETPKFGWHKPLP